MENVQLILIQRFLACLKYFLLRIQFLRCPFYEKVHEKT